MQSPFEYRSYRIAVEDGRYSAKSMDGEPCNLQSIDLLRILRAVDDLWVSVELNKIPYWFLSWMSAPKPILNLDAVDIEHMDQAVLQFPKSPANLARTVTAATAAAVMLMVKATNVMAMLETVAA